jgi:hypothetical protein
VLLVYHSADSCYCFYIISMSSEKLEHLRWIWIYPIYQLRYWTEITYKAFTMVLFVRQWYLKLTKLCLITYDRYLRNDFLNRFNVTSAQYYKWPLKSYHECVNKIHVIITHIDMFLFLLCLFIGLILHYIHLKKIQIIFSLFITFSN